MANPFDQFDSSNPFDQFDEGKFRFASKETEQAGVGAIGRMGQAVEDYFTKPVAPAPANVQAQGYDPLAAYAERTIGNAPRDVTNIASGFTAPMLAGAAYSLYNAPAQTLTDVGVSALQGAKNLITDPVNTFAEQPVSTILGLSAARPVANAMISGGKTVAQIPGKILPKETSVAPGLRAEAQAAKEAGYAGSKLASEAQYNPDAFTNFLNTARTSLEQEGYKPKFTEQFSNINRVFSTLEKNAAKPLPADITKAKKVEQFEPKPVTLGDVEGMRREIGTLYKKGSPDEKRLATVLINEFDKFWENPANALPGSEDAIGKGAANLRIGIDKTHELFQDRVISKIVKKAEKSSDFASTIQKQFGNIVDDETKLGRFGSAQQAIIKDIAENGATSPWVSELATLAPGLRGRKLASFGEAALAYSHPYIAGGIAIAGKGAQLAANRAARKAVNRLAEETFKSKNAMSR
jgi:hypothetical protein